MLARTLYGVLFALNKINIKDNVYEYENKFEIEMQGNDGTDLLISFFKCIIDSSNRMNKNTIMKLIEHTQLSRKSRISNKEEPKLFLLYLPTHTSR